MKKKVYLELCESELKQVIAEYFGLTDKNDISFTVVEGQKDVTFVTCKLTKEIDFPQTAVLGSRPNWWPDGAREIPYVQPTQPIDIWPNPHNPYSPTVTWCSEAKGESK